MQWKSKLSDIEAPLIFLEWAKTVQSLESVRSNEYFLFIKDTLNWSKVAKKKKKWQ